MPDRPTGTLTLLFTDIEGSTRMLQRDPSTYPDVLARHQGPDARRHRVREGVEIKTGGRLVLRGLRQRDRRDRGGRRAQRALHAEAWPSAWIVRVRMGLHTGQVDVRTASTLAWTCTARRASRPQATAARFWSATRRRAGPRSSPRPASRCGRSASIACGTSTHGSALPTGHRRAAVRVPATQDADRRFQRPARGAKPPSSDGRVKLARSMRPAGGRSAVDAHGPGGTGKTRLAPGPGATHPAGTSPTAWHSWSWRRSPTRPWSRRPSGMPCRSPSRPPKMRSTR